MALHQQMFTSKWLWRIFPVFFPLFFFIHVLFLSLATIRVLSSPRCYVFFSFSLLSFLVSFFLFLLILLFFLLFNLSDIKFRVGRGQRWIQEDAEWCATRRECESRPRQIQNTAPDQTGQHKAAHWWVWVHVRTAPCPFGPLSLRGICSRTFPSADARFVKDKKCLFEQAKSP